MALVDSFQIAASLKWSTIGTIAERDAADWLESGALALYCGSRTQLRFSHCTCMYNVFFWRNIVTNDPK